MKWMLCPVLEQDGMVCLQLTTDDWGLHDPVQGKPAMGVCTLPEIPQSVTGSRQEA